MNLELRSPLLWGGSLVNHLTRKRHDWFCVPHRGCLPASGRAAVQAPSALVGADSGGMLSRTCFKSSCDLGWNQCLSWWKWKSLTCVWLCNPMDYTVHGILQARILEWVIFPFSKISSQPRDWTQVSRICRWLLLPAEPQGKPKNTAVHSLSLLQGIFLTQELNQGLLHVDSLPTELSGKLNLTKN